MGAEETSRRVAHLFKAGPIGSVRAGMPRLVRAPLWLACLQGGLALAVVGAGLAAIWNLGDPGRHVQRALLTWLLADYLLAGLKLRVEPEIEHPLAVSFDRPFAYYDDANRELAFVFLWLTPGRWLSHAIAGLALYRQLPTVEQLAEQLYAESSLGVTDYAVQVRSEHTQHPVDEDGAFHQALRRDRAPGMAFALLLCAAGLMSGIAWIADVPDVWALAVALFVEGLTYAVSLLADSPGSAHFDLLHLWVSGQRPEIAREGQQMAQNAPEAARVLLHGVLAVALLMWIHGIAG